MPCILPETFLSSQAALFLPLRLLLPRPLLSGSFPLASKEPCKRNTFSGSFLWFPHPPHFFFFFFNQLFWKMLTSHSAEGKGKGGYLLVSPCVPGLSWAHDLVGERLVLPHFRLAKQGADRTGVVQLTMPSQAGLVLQPVSAASSTSTTTPFVHG